MENGDGYKRLDDVLSQDLDVNIKSLAEELNFATSLEEKVHPEEEVWNNIELVGLSQETNEDIVLAKEAMTTESAEIKSSEEGRLNDSTIIKKDSGNEKSINDGNHESGDTSDVEDSNAEENGYNSEDDESLDNSSSEGRLRKLSERRITNDSDGQYDSAGEEGDGEEEEGDEEEYEESAGESEYSNDGEEAPNITPVNEDKKHQNVNKTGKYKKPHKDKVSDSDSLYESEDGEQRQNGPNETESPNGKDENGEEEIANPTVVPRRTGFWDHDNRFTDISVEESRQPQGNRKLWDKSEIDRWQHDHYVESEQGPKEEWEKALSSKEVDDRDNWRQRNGNRRGPKFGDFFPNSEMDDGTNQNRGGNRGRTRGGYRGGNRGGNRSGRRPNYTDRQFEGNGPNNQDDYSNYEERVSQDYRMRDANHRNPDGGQNYNNNQNNHEDFPELNHTYNKSDTNSNGFAHENNQNSHENYPRNTRNDRERNVRQNEYNADNTRYNHSNRQGNYNQEYVRNDDYRKSTVENDFHGNHDNRNRNVNYQPSNQKFEKEERNNYEKVANHHIENSNKQDKVRVRTNSDENQYNNSKPNMKKDPENGYKNQQQQQQLPVQQQQRVRRERDHSDLQEHNNQFNQRAKPQQQQQQRQPPLQQEQHQRQQSFIPHDEKSSSYPSEEAPARGPRGRGRGVVDSSFKPVYRADEYSREKSSREKRIDQLAPRLREKAREKMVREEREKGKEVKESVDYDPEIYKDAEEGPDGAVRDKPKRYSSQRQKPGSSLLNLPGEVADYVEAEYYDPSMGGMPQPVYNAAPVPVQHIPQMHENIDINKTVKIKILEQQIMQLQAQLHHQSLGPANGIAPSYTVHSNNMMQSVPENHQQAQGYNMESIYNVHDVPQDNPAQMNHVIATMGYPHPAQQNMMPGGLYVPPQQQLPVNDYGYHQQTNCLRPAAIPIKPPPGLQR